MIRRHSRRRLHLEDDGSSDLLGLLHDAEAAVREGTAALQKHLNIIASGLEIEITEFTKKGGPLTNGSAFLKKARFVATVVRA